MALRTRNNDIVLAKIPINIIFWAKYQKGDMRLMQTSNYGVAQSDLINFINAYTLYLHFQNKSE